MQRPKGELDLKYKVIIVGSGPAGLGAALYAKRAQMSVALLESKPMGGGQIVDTAEVDNYLGLPGKDGFSLAMEFCRHVRELGVETIVKTVSAIVPEDGAFRCDLADGTSLQAERLVLAMGAKHRLLGVEGEQRLTGKGVSYCATCDGAFYRKKTVCVIGGGDTALEDALYLSNLAEKVYLIHRRETLRANRSLQERVRARDNIEWMLGCVVNEIIGEDRVTAIELLQRETNQVLTLPISGVFVAVGMQPQTELVKGLVALDETGYIIAGEDTKTSREGIYAVGDIRTKALRQVITAVADGANAIKSIEMSEEAL